mmetsp:Transcript_11570/g.34831  ORF Transcript_11570/g.34831 Transcript_11570/m.34831 type:complete len:319 (-) Transcript_11570:3036-3992(-)
MLFSYAGSSVIDAQAQALASRLPTWAASAKANTPSTTFTEIATSPETSVHTCSFPQPTMYRLPETDRSRRSGAVNAPPVAGSYRRTPAQHVPSSLTMLPENSRPLSRALTNSPRVPGMGRGLTRLPSASTVAMMAPRWSCSTSLMGSTIWPSGRSGPGLPNRSRSLPLTPVGALRYRARSVPSPAVVATRFPRACTRHSSDHVETRSADIVVESKSASTARGPAVDGSPDFSPPNPSRSLAANTVELTRSGTPSILSSCRFSSVSTLLRPRRSHTQIRSGWVSLKAYLSLVSRTHRPGLSPWIRVSVSTFKLSRPSPS